MLLILHMQDKGTYIKMDARDFAWDYFSQIKFQYSDLVEENVMISNINMIRMKLVLFFKKKLIWKFEKRVISAYSWEKDFLSILQSFVFWADNQFTSWLY